MEFEWIGCERRDVWDHEKKEHHVGCVIHLASNSGSGDSSLFINRNPTLAAALLTAWSQYMTSGPTGKPFPRMNVLLNPVMK